MLVKLQPQAFLSFLFRHLKGCHLHFFFKASEKLSLFYEQCVRHLRYLCNYTNEVGLFIVFLRKCLVFLDSRSSKREDEFPVKILNMIFSNVFRGKSKLEE